MLAEIDQSIFSKLRPQSLRASGFSIVEFMIAITLSLLVLAALTGVFVSNSKSRDETEKSNQQNENGRYSLQVLTDDLELAGYLSHFNLPLAGLALPTALPDPCATATASLIQALPLHIQGIDGGDSLGCIQDVHLGSDIVIVRRVSTCISGTTNCALIGGSHQFQASLCSNSNELGSLNPSNYFRLDSNLGNLNRTARNCTTVADMRQYLTHIYYIADNDVSGDGIPTLKRAELSETGGGGFASVTIANGIQDLQLEYGVDTNNDGAPDIYHSDPASLAPGPATTNWANVTAVKLSLLARNLTQSGGFTDTKTYSIGLDSSGTPNVLGPFNDQYRRHAYQTTVRLQNAAIRRE